MLDMPRENRSLDRLFVPQRGDGFRTGDVADKCRDFQGCLLRDAQGTHGKECITRSDTINDFARERRNLDKTGIGVIADATAGAASHRDLRTADLIA